MSPRPSPCDGYTGQLPLYVDHELPEAGSTALESHLEGCARCQERLRELEAVSAVLKGWDAEVPAAPPAPARLARTVLARVEDEFGRRRTSRVLALVRTYGVAAALLLAVGVPWALAVHARATRPVPPPFERLVARAPDAPPASTQPVPHVDRLPSDLLAHVPWRGDRVAPLVPDPLTSDPAARDAFLAGALALQRMIDQERAFERDVGVRGVWVIDRDGDQVRQLLVTPEAARAFVKDDLLDYLRIRRRETASVPKEQPERSLSLAPGDLLRDVLPGVEPGRPALTIRRPGSISVEIRPLTAREADAGAQGPEALDPVLAQERGQLRLEPAPHDDALLNVVVRGTEAPIYLPAGQLVTGGATDLVVRRGTWLPASQAQAVWQVPCAVVRSGPRRGKDAARLLPFVAGPTLRALLLAEADAATVLEHVRGVVAVPFHGVLPPDWSLLDLYDLAFDGKSLGDLAPVVDRAARGFVASDASGRFVGLDHVNLRGEAARPLVARLLHGYSWEVNQTSGKRAQAALGGASLQQAIDQLRAGTTPLVERPAPAGQAAADLSRATLVEPGRIVEAVRVDGRRVALSVLPR